MADTEEEDAESSTKEATGKIDDLLSLETLRESPLQWPERCKYNHQSHIYIYMLIYIYFCTVPGMEEFLTTSETPIHTPVVDPAQILANDNMKVINRKS